MSSRRSESQASLSTWQFAIPTGPVAADPANGPRTVTNFATGIAAGPADEGGQTLTFLVSTPSTGLFTTLPTIDPTTGTLTFTPAAGANGTATVTVRLQDNGSPVGTSAAQTFTIVVGPVNRSEFSRPVMGIENTIPAGGDPSLPRGGQRTYYFDPTYALDESTFDASGRMLFPAGTAANPLDVNRAVQSATAAALRAIQVVNKVARAEA